jgi:succinate dehydrogenase/fumarate reductase flavoprotein subunit
VCVEECAGAKDVEIKEMYIVLTKAILATGGAGPRFVPVPAALLGPSGTPWPHRNGSAGSAGTAGTAGTAHNGPDPLVVSRRDKRRHGYGS